ncbi:MAG: DNA polymerase III subunit gamma/tau [Verrucomicrobiota bacterium]|jgi:DNA polymerase-3 subunit gamma/tau
MSYQVIARKYRPQRFEEVVGQEHVTQTLAHAVAQNRIAHAYLFCGPHGTGKTTIARIFAKCLNATGGPKVDFDDHDPRCREITEGRSLDVLEIDAASNRGIDEIRGLRDTVKYAPAASKFKVYIIDEVHMLTKEAFNALLKTLEEPPAHVKFMFATTEPEKVLPTILSRCQRFDLRRIPAALIVKHLADIARQEKVTVHPAALYAMARGAEGAMRDAQSALDQLISFCGDKIEEADVLAMFGLTAHKQLLDLARAVLAGEVESALRQLHDLAAHGQDLGRLLADLLNHFRNLLIFQVSRGDLNLLEVTEAEAAALADQAKLATTEGLTRILEVLGDADLRLRETTSKMILLEVALLKAIEARNAVSLDALLKQLQGLRAEPGRGRLVSLPTPTPIPAPASAPKPFPAETGPSVAPAAYPAAPEPAPAAAAQMREQHAPAPPAPAGELPQLWARLLEAVGRASPFTRTYLLEAHPVSFTKNLFTIGFDPEFQDRMSLVDNARSHSLLQTKLLELGFPNVQFKFIQADAPERQAAAPQPPPKTPAAPANQKLAPVPFSKEDFKNDPLIQKALELFKGQIVEVRA